MSITSVVNDLVTSVSVINALKPLPPTISGYSVAGKDDLALDPAGGQTVQINGTGFLPGATITFDGSAVAVVTYVNPNQLTFTSPAKTAGTYTIYAVNPDGGTAIYVPGIIYSTLPTWTTAAGSLGSYYETTSISNTVVAAGDAPVTYSLFSGSLPTGSTLSANGVITGTAPVDSSSTTYSFTIQASDAQLQDSTRSFSLTINVDAVTWVSPANATTYGSAVDSAISTVTLSATDAAGYAVSYSANALPTGLSLSGANITGTPTVIADSSTLLTATAATTNRTAVRTINWSITVANDVYFEYNTLLIPGASTTFVDDASTNNFAVTINGDTKPNNTNPYTPGYYSNLFDGTVDRLVPSANAAFAFGTGAFCIEAWMYNTTLKNYSCLVTTRPDNSNYADAYHIGFDSVGGLSLYVNDTSRAGCPAGTVILNTWQHLVCCRNASGLVSIYINGVRKGTETVTTNFTRNLLGIADFPTTPAEGLIGYISNLRLVKGSSVYDPTQTTITVPTTPLTDIANTSILTCQSNRFIDNSTNNFTLTVFGDTKIQSFQPFTPNSSYSTYGSGYFDGTGDYLTSTPSSQYAFGQGDLTVEMWIYPTSNITSTTNIGLFYVDQINALAIGLNNGYIAWARRDVAYDLVSSYIPPLNTWTHVAVVRTGAVGYIFANGTIVGTVTASGGNPSNNSNYVSTTGIPYIAGNYGGGAGNGYFPGYITDVRVVKGTAVYTTTFTPPSAPLTAIANTSLLVLQNNQSVNNNVFLDNSTNNFLVTRNGNTTQGTFSPYGGNWSSYFDGTGDNLSLATATALGTGNTTVEFWFYPTNSSATYRAIYDGRSTVNTDTGYAIFQYGLTIEVYGNGLKVATSASAFTVNNWVYVALVRTSGTCQLYINGVASGSSGTYSANLTSTVRKIGDSANTLSPYIGYISNLREVTSALYSGTFTPSTTPLTAIANTSLLTCQSNRIVDTSINNFTITKTGDTSVQRFSPFNPSSVTPTSYSGYFDGTGDYLTTPASATCSFGTSSLTLEGWFYLTSASSEKQLFRNGLTWPTNVWTLVYNHSFAANKLCVIAGNYSQSTYLIVSTNSLTLNTWNHIAVVRNVNSWQIYINGVADGSSATWSGSVDGGSSSSLFGVGGDSTTLSGLTWIGYISNFRAVNGTAVYTGTFTPPTSPLTAISGTSLLTCQSPTFIDNSTNNFTITAVGNSQPTQQNPFGFTSATTQGYTVSTIGGSGYFDGTGDYLTLANPAVLALGTSNFTIEFWIYTATTTEQEYIDFRPAGTSSGAYPMIYSQSGSLYYFVSGVAQITGSISNLYNSWIHITISRSSGSTKMFINGTQAGSTWADSTNYLVGTNRPAIGYNGNTGLFQYNGYMSDLRINRGNALYISNFVPPSAPLTAVQNTVLLNNMTSAGVYDAAMMNNMETVGGAQLSTAVSKFGGSSMSFDGTGDGLYRPPTPNLDFGTGNFTIEWWMYFNSKSGYQTIMSYGYTPETSTGWLIQTGNGDGKIIFYKQGAGVTIASDTGSTVNTGEWYHMAVVRNLGTTTIYRNGTSVGSGADSNNYIAPTANFYLGGGSSTAFNNYYFNGYIDDLRITKGYARYTSNFTPPTTAFPIY